MFKNRVLRIAVGSKRDEVTGEWRKLRNDESNDLYSSLGYQIEKNDVGGACRTHRGE